MAYLENRIGDFRFSVLQGVPIPPAPRVSRDDRPGVDGQEYMLEGEKGEPFQVVSMVDTDSYAEAQVLPQEYAALQGEDLKDLIHNGTNFTVQGWKVKVLRVRPVDIRRIAGAVGNKISTSAQGWCVCVWDLEAVGIEAEVEEEA